MPSVERSPNRSPFRPEEIPPFSVIKIPVILEGREENKYFVVVSHIGGYAYCLKTTSKTETFDANPDQLRGVVAYDKHECAIIEKRTIIDPRNQFPIPHALLIEHQHNGNHEHRGILPEDFKDKLIAAARNSKVIEPSKKKRLLSQLE